MITTPFETVAWGFPISNRRTASRRNLRVSNTDAQSLRVRLMHAHIKLGDMPSSVNRVRNTYSVDYRESRELAKPLIAAERMFNPPLANSLILLNSVASTESDEGEQYSFSPEHKQYLDSAIIPVGCFKQNQTAGDGPDLDHEKGSTANATLWDDGFFHHEENQHYPALDCDRVTERCADNLPSLRGEPLRLQVTQSHLQNSSGVAQNYSGISVEPHSPDDIGSVNYESFVVQSLGSSFAFLRCSAFSLRPHASSTHEEKFALGLAAFSRSTLVSISSISSCGKRIPFVEERLFLEPVAILVSLCWCRNTIQEKRHNKIVDVYVHQNVMCMCTLFLSQFNIAKPSSVTSTYRASNHNVTRTYTMASSHSTQTRPKEKHLWRFLALDRADMNAIPRRISVEAHTEHDARLVLAPYFILSLAARLPVQGVCNV